MPLLYYVQNSIVALILVTIMLVYVVGQGGRRQAQDSLFVALLLSTLSIIMLELGVDVLSGRQFYGSRALLTLITFLFYVVNPLPGALYLLYLDQLRRRWVKIPRGMGIFAFTPTIFALILIVFSLFNGIIFSIDMHNVYHRGAYFYLVILSDLICMFLGFIYLVIHRQSFKGKDFSLFIFFPLPILLGSFLQIHFYGVEIAGISLAITLLVVYLHMQNSQANKDYLTSLYNRKLSEQYLCHLISHRRKGKTIGGVMMDINNFKHINDTYGHDLGDMCLRYLSRILSDSFGASWFISRYGGDEFLFIRDGVTPQNLEEDLAFFSKQVARFNTKELLPFELSISLGSALYDSSKHVNGTSFIKTLDRLMYEEKRLFHARQRYKN